MFLGGLGPPQTPAMSLGSPNNAFITFINTTKISGNLDFRLFAIWLKFGILWRIGLGK